MTDDSSPAPAEPEAGANGQVSPAAAEAEPLSPQMVALTDAMLEIEAFVDRAGWDQPTRLFALADSKLLVQREPHLAEQLGIDPRTTPLTSVEQEEFDVSAPLDEALARIAWPPDVIGAVLVLERLVLPPSAEASLPTEGGAEEVARAAAEHPDAAEIRLISGVLRGETQTAAFRMRQGEGSDHLTFGEQLAPTLTEALSATFDDI